MNYSKQIAFALGLTLILGACGEESGSAGQNTDLGGNVTTDLVGTGSFSECFNPVLFQDGTFYKVVRSGIYGDSIVTTSITTDIEFNGTPYTRHVQEFSQSNSSFLSRVTSYFSVDFNNQILEEAGRVFVSFNDATGEVYSTTTEIFTPPIRTRFDLNLGEIFTQTYQIDRTFDPSSINMVEEVTKTDRFLGIELINIANRNVDACRVDTEIEVITEPGTLNDGNNTIWVGKDTGLFLQIGTESSGLSQIKSAEINGASVF